MKIQRKTYLECLSFLAVLFYSFVAIAADPSAAMRAAMDFSFPSAKASLVTGELNGDKAPDAAAIVEKDGNLYIIVLLSTTGRRYTVFSSNVFYGNNRRYDTVLIQHGLLVYHTDGSGGCCSHWSNDFKFRFRTDHFRLTGLEEMEFSNESPDNTVGTPSYSFGTSANYLSHTVKYWRTAGRRHVEFIRDIKDSHSIYLKTFFGSGEGAPVPAFPGFVTDQFQLKMAPTK